MMYLISNSEGRMLDKVRASRFEVTRNGDLIFWIESINHTGGIAPIAAYAAGIWGNVAVTNDQ